MLPFKGFLYDAMAFMHHQTPLGRGRKGPCGDMELNYVECLEAYGVAKGKRMCYKYQEDLQECLSANIRKMRETIMYNERVKQLASGKRSLDEFYVERIPYDSYVFGSFMP